MNRYKNQADACAKKMTFFDTESAEYYMRCQPDKTYYKCPICDHYHLTTIDDYRLGKPHIGVIVNRRSEEVKIWSYDGDLTTEYIVDVAGKLLYVQTKMTRKGEKIEYIEVFDDKTNKVSDRLLKKMKRNNIKLI